MLLRRYKENNMDGLVGLDIGPDSIKLLKINSTQSPYLVENFSVLPVPANSIVKGEIKDYAAVSNVLKDLIRQTGVKTKFVALSIPRSLAIIKNINVDSRLTPAEIESRAWIEANRHFPDLVGDIYLDFVILGPSVQDTSQFELMLIACRKDQIKPYLEVLRLASLTAKIVDVSSYALERSLSLITTLSPELETVALLNLDLNLSTLIVVQGKNIIYAHDQSYDGRRLLAEIHNYNNKEKTAEESVSDAGITAILKENLSAHLRHTIHFFYSSRPNISIQKIILSGDCLTIPNLQLFMQQEMGIATDVANPFVSMSIASGINKEKMLACAPALMLSCGLALSKFDIKRN